MPDRTKEKVMIEGVNLFMKKSTKKAVVSELRTSYHNVSIMRATRYASAICQSEDTKLEFAECQYRG